MKLLSRALLASVMLASGIVTTVPVTATPQPQEGRGMLPDLIILRFIGGQTMEVSNPSRAVGGRPHEVVAEEKGIPLPCQAWKEGSSRQGYGFVAEITQVCGN